MTGGPTSRSFFCEMWDSHRCFPSDSRSIRTHLAVNTGGTRHLAKNERLCGAHPSFVAGVAKTDLWRGGKGCGVVETLHVDAGHSAFRVIDEDVGKLCVPDNFVGAVRRPGIDDLGKGLVHPSEQDQKLCATGAQLILRNSVQRAVFVDGVNDGPGERKEDHALPLQIQAGSNGAPRLRSHWSQSATPEAGHADR